MELNLQNEYEIEVFIGNQITEEGAKALANLYNNYMKNRRSISSKITRFINKAKKRKVLIANSEKFSYTITDQTDILFFTEGHALINKIREQLGLEPVVYNVGILDQRTGSAYQIQLDEKEFNKYMSTRGNTKAALSHSMGTVEELLEKAQKPNYHGKDITYGFVEKYLPLLQRKTAEDGFNLNYGYAFEAYGHIKDSDIDDIDYRHDVYYNYYRQAHKNNEAWVTGGDIRNVQYKLIRIYQNEEGAIEISSASVTSANTIIKELTNLQKMLETKDLSPAEISYDLAKHFTQLKIPKKLKKTMKQQMGEALEPYIKNKINLII